LACGDDIFLAPVDIGLYVLQIAILISDVLPAILSFDEYSLGKILAFIAFSTSNTRLCKIHDVESVGLPFFATFCSEMKPLLMPSCIGINLHIKIISILAYRPFFRLQEVPALKKGIKLQNGIAILANEKIASLFVGVDVFQKTAAKALVLARAKRRIFFFFQLVTHDHEHIFFKL
jgi:hypothetical protein